MHYLIIIDMPYINIYNHYKQLFNGIFIRINYMRINAFYVIITGDNMPIKPKDMEQIILNDGWVFTRQNGSHRQYKHPIKTGTVTIPFHPGDLSKRTEICILKQAGLTGVK